MSGVTEALRLPRYPTYDGVPDFRAGNLSIHHKEFPAAISCIDARIEGGVRFACCVFHEPVQFMATTFVGTARFWKCVFLKGADFSSCTVAPGPVSGGVYSGEANFSFSRFHDSATFYGARLQTSYFWRTHFAAPVSFEAAHFEGAAMFNGTANAICVEPAEVANPALLAELVHRGLLHKSFEAAHVWDLTQFNSLDHLRDECRQRNVSDAATALLRRVFQERSVESVFGATASFKGAVFHQPDSVEFGNLNVERCEFAGSNAGLVRFNSVVWPRRRFLWVRDRRAIADEGAAGPEAVGRVYHDLRVSHETKDLLDQASDFRIGEMEMRRLSSARPHVSLLAWYGWLSAYGEAPGLALTWLVALAFVLFPAIYLLIGYCGSGLSCMARSLEASTFMEAAKDPAQAGAGSLLPRLVTGLERVAVAFQAAIFALAVQRKFARK